MRRHDSTTQEQRPAEAPRVPAGAGAAGARALVAQRLADPETVLDMQRTAGNAAVAQLLADQGSEETGSPVLDVVGKGGGQPLEGRTRRGMEQAIGADLGDVRIHNDGAASASAQAVQAHAYTVGNEVVFGSGNYQPDSPVGQRMLAHELTHVVQQRSGPVEGTATGDGIAVSDPSDRFEQAAEANADRIMAAGGIDAHATAGHDHGDSGSSAGPTAQREAVPEDQEEPVQGAWVQRDGGPEEEEEPAS
jgi:hypothetical protein